MIFNT